MTDCEHNSIIVIEHIEKVYVRETRCYQDEPQPNEKVVIWSNDKTESQYHATYCPSGEANCWREEDEEQTFYEERCFECGEDLGIEGMENYNYTIQKYITK